MNTWHLTDLLAAILAPPVVFMAGYNYRNIQAAGRHIRDLIVWRDVVLPTMLHEYVRQDAWISTNKKLDEVGADVKELRTLLIEHLIRRSGETGA